jgi:hypothetical protein
LNRIFKNKSIFNDSIEFSDELVDVYDGTIYKTLLESSDGTLIKTQKAFTFTINTDGISMCDKSKLDIWPVYLVINEIKAEYRYSIENVVIAGNSWFLLIM